MYVIVRNRDGAYVSRPGNASSYTKQLETARIFFDRFTAEKERCADENIKSLDEILGTGRGQCMR